MEAEEVTVRIAFRAFLYANNVSSVKSTIPIITGSQYDNEKLVGEIAIVISNPGAEGKGITLKIRLIKNGTSMKENNTKKEIRDSHQTHFIAGFLARTKRIEDVEVEIFMLQ